MRLFSRLRPSIIDRYVAREIVPPTLLGLILFTFFLLLHQIAVLTGFLVSRAASLGTVLRIIVSFLPNVLALTIPMAFLLGVLLAFGRLASESEIVALRAGGVSPLRLVRPVLLLSILAALPTFYITAFAYPRSNRTLKELSYSVLAGHARTSLRPRVFIDDLIGSGNIRLYMSDIVSSTGEWRDALLRDQREPSKPKLILARRGRLVLDRQQRTARLDLRDGTVYSFDVTNPEIFEAYSFRLHDIRLPPSEIFPANVSFSKGLHERTLPEVADLLEELRARRDEQRAKGLRPPRDGRPASATLVSQQQIDSARVEWHKRFAFPVACVVFGLMGVGLSLGKRREAKSAAFGASIALLFLYYVLLRLGEQFGENGLLHPVLAIWMANLLFGGVALALLAQSLRETGFDPLDPAFYARWLPRRRGPSTPTRAATARRVPGRPPLRLWTILDGYVARQYAGILLLSIAAFWSLGLLIEFMDHVDDIRQNAVSWWVLGHYLAFRAPFHLTVVLPFSYLVATLTTLGILARRNEVTAMKAGGVSVYRLAVPVVVVAMGGSLFLFALGDYVLPFTNRVAQDDRRVIKAAPTQSGGQTEERMLKGPGGRFYEVTAAREHPKVLHSVRIYDVDRRSWTLRECLVAGQARWNPSGYYDLERGWRRTLAPRHVFRAFDTVRTREIEPPSYFSQEVRSADTLRFEDLRRHIGDLAAKGLDVVRLQVDLQLKLALPVVAVVMALLGIPFAFTVGRHGALHGIAVSLVLAILFWVCFRIFEALGRHAFLPAELAMWVPNVLFTAVAAYLLLCIDT